MNENSKQTCSANENGKDCRAYANLTFVKIDTDTMTAGIIMLPQYVVIALCPKHFAWREAK